MKLELQADRQLVLKNPARQVLERQLVVHGDIGYDSFVHCIVASLEC